jgi:hypothetical protein
MIVIITNKLKEAIETSPLREHNYKCANGYFSAQTCANNIKSLEIDKLIVDITAIRDVYEMGAWKHFKDIVDASNIYVLLDNNKSYSNVGFLSMLITLGIYNFAKTTSELMVLLESPNTYGDVEKYQKMAMMVEEKKENAEDQLEDYERKTYEHQEMMKDYMQKYQKGEFKVPRKPKYFKNQLIAGFIALPLLTFLCTFIFYVLEWFIYNGVAKDSYLGKYLYTNVFNTPFNPLVAIGLIISAIIFIIYYNVIDPMIKRKQMSRGKFMILSFGIFCSLIFGDYYLFEIFGVIFNNIPLITKSAYLYQDFYGFTLLVAVTAIFIYGFKTAIANSNELKFEIDLNQSFSLVEKLLSLVMTIIIILPFCYWLSTNIALDTGIYEVMRKIHDQPFIMSGLSIVMFALTAIMIIKSHLYPNKEIVIEQKEEF